MKIVGKIILPEGSTFQKNYCSNCDEVTVENPNDICQGCCDAEEHYFSKQTEQFIELQREYERERAEEYYGDLL